MISTRTEFLVGTTVSQGSTFDIEVDISGAVDLYAYQLDLAFNPTVLQATGTINEGSFFQSGGGFVPGIVDNTSGTITFNADTLLGPISGLTGGGQLIVFEFAALASGSSSLDLANITLLDSNFNNIDFTSTDGSVTVTGSGPVPTPEPRSFLFLSIGICSLLAVFLFKRS